MSVDAFAAEVDNQDVKAQMQTYQENVKQKESTITDNIDKILNNNINRNVKTRDKAVLAATKKSSMVARKYNNSDVRLLSSIIYCEAQGESYTGKLAVGIVVMNRKSSSKFPSTLKGVVYQKNQFQPVRNGYLAKALKEYDAGRFTSKVEKDCIRAAKEALSGTKTVTYRSRKINLKGYYFFSRYLRGCRVQIGHHQFK